MTTEQAYSELELASSRLRNGITVKEGAPKWESRYGQAYQTLVQAGVKPQLRKRYRP